MHMSEMADVLAGKHSFSRVNCVISGSVCQSKDMPTPLNSFEDTSLLCGSVERTSP